MLNFDPDLLTIEEMLIKSCSKNGMLTYIDSEGKTKKEKHDDSVCSIFEKAVIHSGIKKRFFEKPQPMLVLKYNKFIIAFQHNNIFIQNLFEEKGIGSELNTEESLKRYLMWRSYKYIKDNSEKFKEKKWYYDGKFFFTINEKDYEDFCKSEETEKYSIVKGFSINDIILDKISPISNYRYEENYFSVLSLLKNLNIQNKEGEENKEPDVEDCKTDKKSKKEKPEEDTFNYNVNIRSRHVLFYKPRKHKNTSVITPTLLFAQSKTHRHSVVDYNKNYYISLEFYKNALDFVGKNYSIQHFKVLNIKNTLTNLNIINIANVPSHKRKETPVDLEFINIFEWLLGFMYKEQDIYKLKRNCTLINKLFTQSLLKQTTRIISFYNNEDIEETYKQKFSVSELRKKVRS